MLAFAGVSQSRVAVAAVVLTRLSPPNSVILARNLRLDVAAPLRSRAAESIGFSGPRRMRKRT
jgi:hypothetical protein